MKVLITGMSGFVGRNLYEYLSKYSFDVHGLSLRNENWNLEISDDVDVYIHLTGKAHDLKNITTGKEYYEINYNLTKSVFDKFMSSSAKKFIYVSSVKAAADNVIGVLNETVLPSPQTHYGKSKLMAEEYVLKGESNKDKQVYVFRPCMIHGPGNKGNLNLLFKLIQKNIPFPLGCFDNKRSFLSVLNFCFVTKEFLIKENIASGIYNISDSEPLSTLNLYDILSQSINKKPRVWRIPKYLIMFLARLGDTLNLPLNTEKLQKLTSNYIVDNSKILEAIGNELPFTAVDGMFFTGKSFAND